MHIISASRRTDIPHYYADWFRARRREGFADYRTVFGGGKKGFFQASLKPEDVLGYLFWTKFAGPFHDELKALRKDGLPYVFQYTITGYGKEIEPGIPSPKEAIEDFIAVAKTLPGPESIQWRYDPIIISDSVYTPQWHGINFDEIASRLEGHTRVVNVSFIEPYLKIISKVPAGHILSWRQATERSKDLYKIHPELRQVGERATDLVRHLAEIASAKGMQLRVCCNREYTDDFPTAQCCGAELFAPYGSVVQWQIGSLKPGPSRDQCRCLKTIDIGIPDTCPGGCFYCYITSSPELAAQNYKRHDPNSSHLR